MDLNTFFISLFGVMFVYAGYTAWITPIPQSISHIRNGLLVAQDTGKSKQIQSKTGDTSLHIQQVRRQTIKTIGKINPLPLGSITGAIETFLIGKNKA